jgi:hypothetical protein
MEHSTSNEQGIFNPEQGIRWVRPTLKYESWEIERVVALLAERSKERTSLTEKIINVVRTAEPEPLSDEVWKTLENTDSNDQNLTMEKAQRLARENDRNPARIDALYGSGEVEAPIILIKYDGVPHLVSGNTRLMWARALGIRPFVIMVRL